MIEGRSRGRALGVGPGGGGGGDAGRSTGNTRRATEPSHTARQPAWTLRDMGPFCPFVLLVTCFLCLLKGNDKCQVISVRQHRLAGDTSLCAARYATHRLGHRPPTVTVLLSLRSGRYYVFNMEFYGNSTLHIEHNMYT
ncbi:hypothetical protein J6590_007789 [Homalodisca vitripennis]|nr:hypothetical protein J6590_007789 [Homalodisca vitripennis]